MVVGMQDPIVLTLCPDGHLDGPRMRVIVPREAIHEVRELPPDPGSPSLALVEVMIFNKIGAPKWAAVEDSFDEIVDLLGADRLVEVTP